MNQSAPTITAFRTSPDRGRGMARDLRVRWALEEAGRAYEVRLLTFAEMREAGHLALQPFGQIPTYEEGEVRLFETGAIVLHIASGCPDLLPTRADARGRALSWMFAALNTVEPILVEREVMARTERDAPWFAARLSLLDGRVARPLAALSAALGDGAWLEGGFTAGDLMMAAVLFRARPQGVLAAFPNLVAYVARAEGRPAFVRAFEAQRAVFEANAGEG